MTAHAGLIDFFVKRQLSKISVLKLIDFKPAATLLMCRKAYLHKIRSGPHESAGGDETAVDDATLNVATHRLESLIHDRRNMPAKKPAIVSAA
jgi:hypothetical protein